MPGSLKDRLSQSRSHGGQTYSPFGALQESRLSRSRYRKNSGLILRLLATFLKL